ncbi:MAG: KpsF/GutQ family sugar-phosphate isomerase [Candidatus Brocadiae bacterium]|nr:KpsF/GutQ family sugar-phosphate isomerase [Candidatus Brocadiia bacterium]
MIQNTSQSQEDTVSLVGIAKKVLAEESLALSSLCHRLDDGFEKACQIILQCKGRVIITGMGKSGHIGQKIAASFTSTGVASHFLHPAEGFHGDLGIVHRKDVLLALSFSGETKEILDLLFVVKGMQIPVVAITSSQESTLGKAADATISLGQVKEADPYNLVPTTSTTLTLAIGDALTVALMKARNFTPEDFAVFHPKGMLGKRLTLQVKSLLNGEKDNPVIRFNDTFSLALKMITQHSLGGTSIVDDTGKLIGILTDGDIRRIMEKFADKGCNVSDVMTAQVYTLMTKNPTHVYSHTLAYDALKLMENHKPRPIFILPVVDESHKPAGMLHLHALVQAGFKTNCKEDI